ncbi:PREDICTED: uncharacterized protein LOC106102318 [Papilio polytes]|uniref:uncharacterized protein LOC106102318 n=1 Tax=Papilio polytes TaxID=76194 RepID=UPI000675EA96|nr:PREDICTED: uncharacterized protein LOC106102318 [Papilio polytes]
MASTMVKFAVLLFAVCVIGSLNAAATGTRNIREVEEVKDSEADAIKPRGAGAGPIDIAELFKDFKSKADFAKIIREVILVFKGGDSPLKL